MRIAITGANGFVGQHLIKKLGGQKNWEILALCRSKKKEFFVDIHAYPQVVVKYGMDILDCAKLLDEFRGVDTVVHLAGLVSFRQKDAKKLIAINHQGTLNVLRASQKAGVKQLIYVSSTAALGFGPDEIDEQFVFDWSPHKKCRYAYSKHLPEKEIMASAVNTVIVYPSLILGPGDTSSTKKLLESVQQGKMKFSPQGSNSIIDVRDFVEVLEMLIKRKQKKERFIVTGGSYTYAEINQCIAEFFKRPAPRWIIPSGFKYPLASIARMVERIHPNPPLTYENVFFAFCNRKHTSEKVRKLGFSPQFDLKTTVKDAWCSFARER